MNYTNVAIWLTLLIAYNSNAETIPVIKMPNYPMKKIYWVNQNTNYYKDTPEEACGQYPDWYYDSESGNCLTHKNKYEFMIVYHSTYCADGTFNKCDLPIESCPIGYQLVINMHGRACYRPDDGCERDAKNIPEIKLLAAIINGESSGKNDYNELQALASATLRHKKATKRPTVNELIIKQPTYSFVVCNGNQLYNQLLCNPEEQKFKKAYEAARSAMNDLEDLSNGGCYWDGRDLKYKGVNHTKYKEGFKYSSPSHNLYGADEPPPRKRKHSYGTYTYKYISTAAYGGTIFWKLTDEYITASGKKQCT